MLLGLIFSFHIQYRQPPSFYLKSPTLMYVYVLIALRALNFEARYIVTAGLVAAVGWLLMVLYVVMIDPRDSMVTRDYITYMTSNSVLIGAEVDKIISILVFTIVLALASKRTARLLEFAAVESASNQELARFVPNEVVAQIKTAERTATAGQGETEHRDRAVSRHRGLHDAVREPVARGRRAHAERVLRGGGRADRAAQRRDQPVPGRRDHRDVQRPAPESGRTPRARSRPRIEIVALCGARPFGDGARLSIRVGINTGPMVCGSDRHARPPRLHGDRRRSEPGLAGSRR